MRLSLMTVSITSLSSPQSNFLYHSTCLLVRGTKTVNSLLDGRDIATWSFTLRSMNTPNKRLALRSNLESTRPFTRSNPVSNLSAVAGVKTSEARKCSRAHSSLRLFCSGVPVRMIFDRQDTERSFSLN